MKTLAVSLLILLVVACNESPRGRGNELNQQQEKQSILGQGSALGFYPLDTASLPTWVLKASESVFILKVLALDDDRQLLQVDVSIGKSDAFKKSVMSSEKFDEMEKIVLIKQIEKCEQGDIETQKNCVVFTGTHQSSGFLLGSGSELWTNAHAVEPSLALEAKMKEIEPADLFKSGKRVAVFIFNQKSELLFNPFIETATLKTLPQMTNAAKMKKRFYAEDSDYVGLSLSKKIGEPLRKSTLVSKVGNSVLLLGYPACTNCQPEDARISDINDFANRSPGLNSDGHGLKVSVGQVLSVESSASFFGVSESAMSLYRLDRMFFYSADSHRGSSGGPVMNTNGEVVGIHTGGKGKIVNGKLERVSRGVALP